MEMYLKFASGPQKNFKEVFQVLRLISHFVNHSVARGLGTAKQAVKYELLALIMFMNGWLRFSCFFSVWSSSWFIERKCQNTLWQQRRVVGDSWSDVCSKFWLFRLKVWERDQSWNDWNFQLPCSNVCLNVCSSVESKFPHQIDCSSASFSS